MIWVAGKSPLAYKPHFLGKFLGKWPSCPKTTSVTVDRGGNRD